MIFDKIIGHQKNVLKLKQILQKKPVPNHALLFCGPSGIGKKRIALAWAQGILCEKEKPPCGKCHSCLRVQSQQHPDLLMIDTGDAASIKIEQVRQIQNFSSLKSFEAGSKVIIIDAAEKLTQQAANALLKTLEEPPEGAYFSLITSNRGAVLGTILSRCQKILFGHLTNDELTQIVPQAEPWTIRIAQGSAELALKLSDESLKKTRTLALKFLSDLPQARFFEGFTALAPLYDERQTALFVTDCWNRTLKTALSQKFGVEIEASSDEKQAVSSMTEHFSTDSMITITQKISRLEQDILANVNKTLAFEKFFIDLKNL